MRIWHKDLIPVLPRQQLLSQWRECCCIVRNIAVNGTPNHLLVNKIMVYSMWHFCWYAKEISDEMKKRNYKVNDNNFDKWIDWSFELKDSANISHENLFLGWHNDRYLRQCYYNLQEKYDCGGIPEDEWQKVHAFVYKKLGRNNI